MVMPKICKTDFMINHSDVLDTFDYVNEKYDDFTDEQLEKIDRFKKLEIYQQDLYMMYSQGYSLREIGAMLDVSYQWVRLKLKEINNILNE